MRIRRENEVESEYFFLISSEYSTAEISSFSPLDQG